MYKHQSNSFSWFRMHTRPYRQPPSIAYMVERQSPSFLWFRGSDVPKKIPVSATRDLQQTGVNSALYRKQLNVSICGIQSNCVRGKGKPTGDDILASTYKESYVGFTDNIKPRKEECKEPEGTKYRKPMNFLEPRNVATKFLDEYTNENPRNRRTVDRIRQKKNISRIFEAVDRMECPCEKTVKMLNEERMKKMQELHKLKKSKK